MSGQATIDSDVPLFMAAKAEKGEESLAEEKGVFAVPRKTDGLLSQLI